MSELRTHRAAPSASLLIESMRDIGYTLESALADVIDNAISAHATRINIFADSEKARVGILDNGIGMSSSELMAAMKPGCRNPLEPREPHDLGRFGLGLKTASFSQCRRLTVVSRQSRNLCAAVWDLDHVAKTDDWLIQIPDGVSTIPWSDHLKSNGTLILWEKLDRIVEEQAPDGGVMQFVKQMDDASRHIELVFHRFLAGEAGIKKISINLNNRPLEAHDPFNSRHPATVIGPPETRDSDICGTVALPRQTCSAEIRSGLCRTSCFSEENA